MAREGCDGADTAELEQLKEQASEIFTPGSPISDRRLFSGRDEIIEFLSDECAMNPRKCLVLYGERDVGKTSFCNVLFDGRRMLKHNCSKSDDFVTIFLNILSKAGEQFTESERKVLADAGYKIGSDNMLSVEAKVGVEEVDKPVAQQTLDLNFVLRRFLKANAGIDVIFLDEFQNVSEPSIQSGIIEVVKGIADDEHTKVVTVIAGIADADTELLTSQDYEQYKGRHFVAQKLPRMQTEELKNIIDRRRNMFKIQFDAGQEHWIAYIAAGLPQYVHKVALSAMFSWITDNDPKSSTTTPLEAAMRKRSVTDDTLMQE